VRIFNTYGPRMDLNDGRALPNMLKQALLGHALTVYGDGKQTRSFCYVDDLVEGVVRLLHSEEHLPVNIGNPVEMTLTEFASQINKVVGNRGGMAFVPEARVGDYVVVHVGFAISILDEAEANRVFEYVQQLGEAGEVPG